MKAFLFFPVAAIALCLSACMPAGGPSPSAQNNIANALAASCPILAAAKSSASSGAAIQGAYALLANVCPPNAPPSSAAVAALDILNAYGALRATIK